MIIKELRFDMWMNILKYLTEHTNSTITAVTINIEGSYSHVFNILKLLRAKDLIIVNKQGRKNIIELTNKGWIIANHVKNLQYLMEE